MDFNLKTYKSIRIRHYFKTINCFFFFHGGSINNKSWIEVEQNLANHKLRYYRILNKAMIKTLKNSIFKNLVVLIHGPILLLSSNNANLTFKELENINPFIGLLSFKLNNKIYSKEQIKNCQKLSYLSNVSSFHNSLKTITRMPYYKIKSKKTLPLSK